MPRTDLRKILDPAFRPAGAVVFLHGEEEYLREEAVRRIADRFLDPAMAAFNLDQLRGGDATPETLASLVSTPPMMAEHRVVVVRDVQGLTARTREVVEAAAAKPSPGVILLLSGTIPSGSKAKFYSTLTRLAHTLEFPALHEHDLPGWLVERARSEHDVELELDAARALSAAIGSQLGALATELEKAVAYASGRNRITLEDVRAVGGYIPRVDRWGWFDRIGERRFEQALEDLPELLASGESAVGLVIGMGGHLLKVGIAVAGGREGLERALRPNQRWLAQRLLPQARRWTAAEIDAAMAELLRTDRLLKSASLTDRQAMEELLLRLLNVGQLSGPRTKRSRAAAVRA